MASVDPHRMRTNSTLRAVMAAGFAICLTGCLELELEVELKADGSGTQHMVLGMTDKTVHSVRTSAAALDASGKRTDPLSVFDAKQVTDELESLGLVVKNHRSYREGAREFVDVEAEFQAFKTLQASTLFGAEGEWFALAGRNAGGIRIVYYPRGHDAWLAAKQRAAELRAQPTAAQKQFFSTQKRKLQGFDVGFRLTLPGDIDYCSSNLTCDGKRAVVASVDAKQIKTAADLVRALAPRYEVEFAGAGTKIPLDRADPGLQAPKTPR